MKKLLEIIQADDGTLSLTRLLCLASIVPATYVLVQYPSEGMLGLYLGAYVTGYIGGKGLDAMMGKKDVNLS